MGEFWGRRRNNGRAEEPPPLSPPISLSSLLLAIPRAIARLEAFFERRGSIHARPFMGIILLVIFYITLEMNVRLYPLPASGICSNESIPDVNDDSFSVELGQKMIMPCRAAAEYNKKILTWHLNRQTHWTSMKNESEFVRATADYKISLARFSFNPDAAHEKIKEMRQLSMQQIDYVYCAKVRTYLDPNELSFTLCSEAKYTKEFIKADRLLPMSMIRRWIPTFLPKDMQIFREELRDFKPMKLLRLFESVSMRDLIFNGEYMIPELIGNFETAVSMMNRCDPFEGDTWAEYYSRASSSLRPPNYEDLAKNCKFNTIPIHTKIMRMFHPTIRRWMQLRSESNVARLVAVFIIAILYLYSSTYQFEYVKRKNRIYFRGCLGLGFLSLLVLHCANLENIVRL